MSQCALLTLSTRNIVKLSLSHWSSLATVLELPCSLVGLFLYHSQFFLELVFGSGTLPTPPAASHDSTRGHSFLELHFRIWHSLQLLRPHLAIQLVVIPFFVKCIPVVIMYYFTPRE